MAQTHLPDKWIPRLLGLLELSASHQNFRLMQAWSQAEGGTAKWNPLNTTLHLSGTVDWTEPEDYNSIGVCDFKYGIVGIVATVLTFQQRDASEKLIWASLLSDMKAGTMLAENIVKNNATLIQNSWGTNPDTMLQILKGIS